MLRLGVVMLAAVAAVLVGTFLFSRIFPPPPAGERLAGVTVELAGYTLDGGASGAPALADNGHRLDVRLTITSAADIADCMAFTIDAPFAGRRLEPISTGSGDCVHPVAGGQTVELRTDRLTDDDLAFPSHTIVWGIRGGSCGLVLEAVGVCVVEQAGTVPIELPRPPSLPSFGPFGSFGPIFSFEPFSFDLP